MGLLDLLKKSVSNTNVSAQSENIQPPVSNENKDENEDEDYDYKEIQIVMINHHRKDIILLLKDLFDNGCFLDEKYSFRLPCKLEHEPTNAHDPNAIKVFVKCPNNRQAEWRPIGYISRNDQDFVNKSFPLIYSRKYYWHLYFDFVNAAGLELSLRKSKFYK